MMSFWVQRAGRAARGHGRKGLAVMLVEKTAFETGVETTRSGRQQRVARRKKRASTADCEAEEGGVETAEDAGDAGQSRGRTTPSCAVRSAGGTAVKMTVLFRCPSRRRRPKYRGTLPVKAFTSTSKQRPSVVV
jgi:superfamily II DNA or RNA helicase